jgi:hypothetical protein
MWNTIESALSGGRQLQKMPQALHEYYLILQAANWRVVKGKTKFVLALALSFSELFTKLTVPIFSARSNDNSLYA